MLCPENQVGRWSQAGGVTGSKLCFRRIIIVAVERRRGWGHGWEDEVQPGTGKAGSAEGRPLQCLGEGGGWPGLREVAETKRGGARWSSDDEI